MPWSRYEPKVEDLSGITKYESDHSTFEFRTSIRSIYPLKLYWSCRKGEPMFKRKFEWDEHTKRIDEFEKFVREKTRDLERKKNSRYWKFKTDIDNEWKKYIVETENLQKQYNDRKISNKEYNDISGKMWREYQHKYGKITFEYEDELRDLNRQTKWVENKLWNETVLKFLDSYIKYITNPPAIRYIIYNEMTDSWLDTEDIGEVERELKKAVIETVSDINTFLDVEMKEKKVKFSPFKVGLTKIRQYERRKV